MRVAVVGSRTFNDYELMKDVLDDYYINIIISGNSKGTDHLSLKYAQEFKIKTKRFVPFWSSYGKRAIYIRNLFIIKESNHVIAFWDGNSKGTKHAIDIANKFGKTIRIINFKNIGD